MTDPLPVIGLLYAGEMGTALGASLAQRGCRVVTSCTGRSNATLQRCRKHGFEVLPTLEDVISTANVVLSVVLPNAAEAVATDVAAHAHRAPAGAMYVDVNSIQPAAALRVARILRNTRYDFVDATVNGLARNVGRTATIFLSGPRADALVPLFDSVIHTQLLGSDIGQASAMKMMLAGVSKGVCSLLLQLLLSAEAHGLRSQFIQAMQRIYPGIWELGERMLPTYAIHAARRSIEMAELEQATQAVGIDTTLIAAIRRMHDALADQDYPPQVSQDLTGFIDHLREAAFLERPSDHTQTEAASLQGVCHGQ